MSDEKTNKNQDLTIVIEVDATPEAAYAAINDVRGWWSGNIEGPTDKLGEEFSYRYEKLHYSKQKVVELEPGKRVVWLITDSFLDFVEDKKEWNGTRVVFDITKRGDKTEIRFTHAGLVPAHECFTDCSDAWGSYIRGSLKNLIVTGKGKPNA